MPVAIPSGARKSASAPRAPPRRRGNAQAARASRASGTKPLMRWSAADVPCSGWKKLSSATCSPITATAARNSWVLVIDLMHGSIPARGRASHPASRCLVVRLPPGRGRGRPAGGAAGEEASAQERALERAVAVHAAAAEAGDLAGGVQAGNRLALLVQHAGVQVGMEAAER